MFSVHVVHVFSRGNFPLYDDVGNVSPAAFDLATKTDIMYVSGQIPGKIECHLTGSRPSSFSNVIST